MKNTNILLALMSSVALVGVGCTGSTSNPPPGSGDMAVADMAMVGDLAGQDLTVVVPDLALADLSAADLSVSPSPSAMPFATTLHDIDVNVVSPGPLSYGALVSVTGTYLLGQQSAGFTSKTLGCGWTVYGEDTACTGGPPCGIELQVYEPNPGSCPPSLAAASTPLSSFAIGQTVDLTGTVRVFAENGVTNHQLLVTSATLSATQGPSPAPIVDLDPSLFADQGKVTPDSPPGTGWKTYEGMYVTIEGAVPAVTPLIISTASKTIFTAGLTAGAIAPLAATFQLEVNTVTLPKVGSRYLSVSGWVYTDNGGAVVPLSPADLVPSPTPAPGP